MMGTALNYWWADGYWRTNHNKWVGRLLVGLTNFVLPIAEKLFPWPANTANWVMVARKK